MSDNISEKDKLSIELLNQALEQHESEYKELFQVSRTLETKAQITIVTFGIFITASTNLIKGLKLNTVPSPINLFLACAIICLALSVACAICVFSTRKVATPPSGKGYLKLANDTIKLIKSVEDTQEIIDETRVNIIDQIRAWEPSIESYTKIVQQKAQQLDCSQKWLLAGMGLVSIVTIIVIFYN